MVTVNHIDDGIFTINGIFTAVECEDLIKRGEDLGYEAAGVRTSHGPKMMTNVRNNDRVEFKDKAFADDVWLRVEPFIPPVLDGVPASRAVVSLAPLEAVSRKSWDGDPTWFKRMLGSDDLTLLKTLGVLERPLNGALFHGHVEGKSGLRPTTDLWLTLHHVVDAEKSEVEAFTDPVALRLLHFESYSGEDFVRKWTSILGAGPKPNFRPAREPTAIALQTLIAKGLSAEAAEPYLMRIFERTCPRAGWRMILSPKLG